MNERTNIAEYSVKKSRSTFFLIMRIVAPILSVLISIFISNMIVGMYELLIGIISLIVLLSSSLLFLTRYFRRIDYDYRIVGSDLFFSAVYNRKKRKELGSVDITKLEKIAPYTGKYADEADEGTYETVHDFSSSPSDPYVFYAIEYDDENKTKTLYFFNASEKMLKLIKLYNRRAITDYPDE